MYKLDLSQKELESLQLSLKTEKNIKIYRRLQCVHFKVLGLKHNIIAGSIGVHPDTVTDWLKLYTIKGIEGLCNLNYDGRRTSKLDEVADNIKAYISENMVDKISMLQDYLLTQHDMFVEHSWLYRYCKKNSIHLIKKQD
jgi:transposase